jgi:hypothetical protein
MFKIIKDAIRNFFHFLNPDRCRFYARQLGRITQISRQDATDAIIRPKTDRERVMALANLMDQIHRLASENYEL